jgi:hypothetical protein
LPGIRGLPERAYGRPQQHADKARENLRLVEPGERDAVMFREVARICKRVYRAGGTMEQALTEAMARHAEFPVPHENAGEWVGQKVAYWWRKTLAGENRFGEDHCLRARGWRQALAASDVELLALLCWLEEENGPEAEFWIANGLTDTHLTGWSLDRLQAARRRALEAGWIVQIVRAATGRAAVYRWGPRAFATIFA